MISSKAIVGWLSALYLACASASAATSSVQSSNSALATFAPLGVSNAPAEPATNALGLPVRLAPATLFAYFRQRYETRVEIDTNGVTRTVPLPDPMREEQLHFALSSDGRHWTPLNNNRPVWTQRLRDPYLQKGPDALWRLVATGGNGLKPPGSPAPRSQVALPLCLYAESSDLLTWTNVHALSLMTGVRDETGRAPRNLWAPEWFYDQKNGDYFVFWSASFEDAGWKQSRLWFCRTRDWQTFTPAKVLFHPPYSVIDGTLMEHNGTYYLFHKEEEFGAAKGERRAIRLATATQLEGPYKIFEGPLNNGQIAPIITEGPELIPDPADLLHQPSTLNNQPAPNWLLIYDYCMSNRYGASSSSDLLHWTVEPSVSFPPDARHGCFAPLTAEEAAQLRARFSFRL